MAITVGSVEVDVIPNTQGIYQRLRAGLVPAATRAGEDAGKAAGRSFGPAMQAQIGDIGLSIGQQIGRQIAARITAEIRGALRDGITQGGAAARPAASRQGEETGGAFARTLRAKLQEAFHSMPKLDVKLSDTGVDAELARLRARMETLSNKRIGIDVDVAAADAEVADIEERLRRLGTYHPNVTVRADTAAARVALLQIREEIDRVSANPAHIRVETDGTFGQRLRAQVQAAQASLPNINIGADTTPADVEIARLRAQLGALADQRIGIDIDAATATAKIDEIKARLERLSASSGDVAVRVDSATALAQLAQVQAMVSALDGRTARVNVDTSGALSAVFQLTIALGAVAALPAIPILGAGVGGLTAAFVAAGAGVGAFAAAALPALSSIKAALTAQTAAQTAATTATAKSGQASAQAASRALQLAGAQQALATAQRNGARQIASAEQAVGDAARSAAQANVQAAQQVKQAKQAVADAVRQAADQQAQAEQKVIQAEQSLAQAQKSAKQAQLDLTQARVDATRQLQDMNNQLADSKLSERDATLAVQQAQLSLNAVLANPNASAAQRAQAQLTYDQAVQHLKEQKLQTARLAKDTAAANKAGVNGSATVKSAQDQLAQAQQGVIDKTAALKQAQADVTKTEIANARSIAEAQSKLADAQKNVATVQQQGAEAVTKAQQAVVAAQQSAADSVTSAQRQIESAQLSAAGATDQAATAQNAYRAALAKLTPSARKTFDAFVNLKSAFKAWSTSLQPAIMPIFTRALVGMKNSLPGLTPLVLAAAKAISGLQDRVSRGFKSPWWKSFKKDLDGSVGSAITGLGVSFGRIFKGMAGIVDAFLPHMDGISTTMQRITGRFANWGAGLKGSPAFERFLDYASQQAPIVARFLGKLMGAFTDLSKALAPASQMVYAALSPLLSGVSWLSKNMPGLIQFYWGLFAVTKLLAIGTKAWAIAVGLYSTATKLATLETWSFAAALTATGWTEIVALVVAIVAAIAALVAGIIWAYKNVGWFHAAVVGAWTGIKVATLFLWNSVLKPAFDGIVIAVKAVGTAAVWLWNNAIKPAFNGIVTATKAIGTAAMWLWTNAIGPAFRFIWEAAKILATIIIIVVIAPIIIAFKLLSIVAMALWTYAIKPVFGWIADRAKRLYKSVLKPLFDLMVKAFHAVGAAGTWLWNHAIKPSFNWIAGKAVWLYKNVLKPQFNLMISGFKALGSVGKWLYNNAIRPAFNWISDKAKWLWSKALKPTFDAIKKGVGLVGTAFQSAKDFIGKQWSKVADLAKKPIKFVIDTVYNSGIVPLWNKVAGLTGAKKLTAFHPKGWATGGVLPGYTPGRDVHRFVSPTGGALDLSGGEAVMRPEFTRAMGVGAINSLNAAARSGGVTGVQRALGAPGLAGGGVIDWLGDKATSVGHGIKSAVTTGVDWAKTGADLLVHPGKIWDKLSSPIKDLIGKIGSNPWAKLNAGIPIAFIKGLKDKLVELVGLGGGAASAGAVGGSGVKRWSSVVLQSLGLVGQPASLLDTVLRRMNQESGGNPTIVNRTDSNWQAGYPSVGLMQVIRGTFQHYAGRFKNTGPFEYGVSTNPLANIYASMKYAMSRYGSLASAYNRAGGYDSGGYLQPGLNLAYNGTGRPEPVFTSAQASALTRLAAAPAGSGGGTFEGDLYLDSGAFLGHVRGEVHQQMTGLTTTLRAGRKG